MTGRLRNGLIVLRVLAIATMLAPVASAASASADTVTVNHPADGSIMNAAGWVGYRWSADFTQSYPAYCELQSSVAPTIWSICSSFSWTSPFPPEGDYVFTVSAYNMDDVTVWGVSHFAVDNTAPSVSITPIASPTNSRRPGITFTATDAHPGTVICQFDSLPVADCPSAPAAPGSDLADGNHTFKVVATDAASNTLTMTGGNVTTETFSFVVDATPPTVIILSPTPGQLFDVTGPTISFSVPDGTAVCRYDDEAYVPCDAAFLNRELPDGPHTLWVRATDVAGNVTEQSVAFTIDTSVAVTGTEVPLPSAHSLTASRGGKVRHGRFNVPVSLRLTLPAGTTATVACLGTVSFSLKPRIRRARTVTKRARLKVSGSQCVARTRISLLRKYKGKKATVRARFGGSAALGSFSYSKTTKRL